MVISLPPRYLPADIKRGLLMRYLTLIAILLAGACSGEAEQP
jgi:hypothetical protein